MVRLFQEGGCCGEVPVTEIDRSRVGQLRAHQPRGKQVSLMSRPTISWR